MSTQDQVPSNIAEIIEEKRQALLAERQAKEEAEKRERQEAEAIGKAKYDEYLQAALSKVPEYLHRYIVPSNDQPDFYRIGRGWNKPDSWLYFEIPGLAKLLFAPTAKESPWKYQVASPYEEKYDYDGDLIHVEPSLNFSERSHGWVDDLPYALGCARKALLDYQQYLAEYATKKEEIAKGEQLQQASAEEHGIRNPEAQSRRELKQLKEQTEEQALFGAIKDDPIVIHMLKAFVFLRDERSTFEQRLQDADETMSSIENRWSRRAEELRRQADEADRRAEDERRRLQDDLDDAEKKLKKSERRW